MGPGALSLPLQPQRRGWVVASCLLGLALSAHAAPEPGQARRAELIRLVRQDCGSCHGMQLTGGLGLPLTPQALEAKPDGLLTAAILYGRPGTPMPPWQPFLSESEAAWIVDNLKRGFPDAPVH